MKVLKVILVMVVLAFVFCAGMITKSAVTVNKLEALAVEGGVEYSYVTTDAMIEAKAKYNLDCVPAGLYVIKDKSILIDQRYYFEPLVLAHELGHHFAIIEWGDQSEAAANVYGAYLFRGVE